MTDESLVLEPAVDRWAELSRFDRKPIEKEAKVDFMRLSAGIMAPSSKATSNRIDGLLSKMVEDHHHVVRYSEDIDKNLDYLFTYLQLDMINILAENCTREPEESEESLLSL